MKLNELIIKALTDENGEDLKVNSGNQADIDRAISKAVWLLKIADTIGFDAEVVCSGGSVRLGSKVAEPA